ncbi:MAG: 50S ribosomal protein L4 [Desulfobacterales bacterium]|jgi:large subunit ribosomal protein L4|nr:50S ribosomal protein L4 [Desulfobacteraceae bacterium]MDD3991351.1 50S ribosomal protein L4 [Desulfobacteraceae bacterium]MDY0310597.1 50S ribosomal protein L4 [Desulfobacterales bacterium]
MAVVDVLNIRAEKVSELELPEAIFNVPVRPGLLHEVVTVQLGHRRSATASVRHRGDVAGSTRKLFKQKGTGRARRGDIKSPLLRGGGVVFGPDGRNYAAKLNKKVRRLAVKMALSAKLAEQALIVVDQMVFDAPKTKDFVAAMRALNLGKTLIVTDGDNPNLELSARNVPGVRVMRAEGLNAYDLLNCDQLVLLAPSVRQIEGRLA